MLRPSFSHHLSESLIAGGSKYYIIDFNSKLTCETHSVAWGFHASCSFQHFRCITSISSHVRSHPLAFAEPQAQPKSKRSAQAESQYVFFLLCYLTSLFSLTSLLRGVGQSLTQVQFRGSRHPSQHTMASSRCDSPPHPDKQWPTSRTSLWPDSCAASIRT